MAAAPSLPHARLIRREARHGAARPVERRLNLARPIARSRRRDRTQPDAPARAQPAERGAPRRGWRARPARRADGWAGHADGRNRVPPRPRTARPGLPRGRTQRSSPSGRRTRRRRGPAGRQSAAACRGLAVHHRAARRSRWQEIPLRRRRPGPRARAVLAGCHAGSTPITHPAPGATNSAKRRVAGERRTPRAVMKPAGCTTACGAERNR